MNITDQLYKREDEVAEIIELLKLKNKSQINAIDLEKTHKELLFEWEKAETEADRAILNDKFEAIERANFIIQEYTANTVKSMNKDGYNLTLEQAADILSIKDIDYMCNSIKVFLDSFNMSPIARQFIKTLGKHDRRYLSKEVFISVDSIKRFLMEHLRITNKRVQLDLTLDRESKDLLFKKFKDQKQVKTKFAKVAIDLDKRYEENINRKDYMPQKPENLEQVVEDIINKKVTLQSKNDLAKQLKNDIEIDIRLRKEKYERFVREKEAEGFKVEPFEIYEYAAVSNATVYRLIDYRINASRYVLDNLYLYDNSRKVDEKKTWVRYSANLDDIKYINQNRDALLISVSSESYKKLLSLIDNSELDILNSEDEAEYIRKFILNYFIRKALSKEKKD